MIKISGKGFKDLIFDKLLFLFNTNCFGSSNFWWVRRTKAMRNCLHINHPYWRCGEGAHSSMRLWSLSFQCLSYLLDH